MGDEPRIKPDHAAHICALGRRSALCNLSNLLVIMFDSPHRAVTHFARALFYKVAAHDLSRSFSKNISSLGWITRNVLTLPEKILFLEFECSPYHLEVAVRNIVASSQNRNAVASGSRQSTILETRRYRVSVLTASQVKVLVGKGPDATAFRF